MVRSQDSSGSGARATDAYLWLMVFGAKLSEIIGLIAMVEPSDLEFAGKLRAAVLAYLQAVDRWEAAYQKYYRLPGHPQTISSDMQPVQREYEAQRRVLESMVPRALQLSLEHQLQNPIPGLLQISLGEYAPQHRMESAVSRSQRSAVVTCLEQLADACREYAPSTARPSAPRMNRPRPARGVRAGSLGAMVALCLIVYWSSRSSLFPQTGAVPESMYGGRSGAEIRDAFETERKRESDLFSDMDLERMVGRLFEASDPGRKNFHGLLYAGTRPVPFLLKALEDPRTATTVFPGKPFDPIEISPFSRICSLLEESAPAEAVRPLTPYLEHPDPAFRREAASLLARIGTSECLEPVKKALADKDEMVREFTLMGLQGGLKAQRRDATFLSGVFPAVEALLTAGNYKVRGPAGVLAEIDSEKAAPILESPRYFSARNPQLREVLEALDRKELKVPRTILLPLLAELEPLAQDEGVPALNYAAALILYARNPDDRAGSRFESLIRSRNSTVASAAARGLEILAGIRAHEAVWKACDERGFTAMSRPQQFYYAVELYRDEVDNGGHEQYFYNDDSDLYETAIEGLRAIGAPEKAQILSNASSAFAPLGPARANQARRLQMEGFGQLQEGIFRTADKRFYASEREAGKGVDVLLTLYALKHREDFL